MNKSIAVKSFTFELPSGHIVIIDEEDWDKVKEYSWYLTGGGRYAGTDIWIKELRTKKQVLLHRFIMKCPDNMQIDHANNQGLDNRKENLRVCTNSENAANKKKQRNNTSGYTGVFLDKRRNKYHAKVTKDKKEYHLGYFDCPKEAARAYDKKKIELFGMFARTNRMENWMSDDEKKLKRLSKQFKMTVEELISDE